jgi:hypothetical protein
MIENNIILIEDKDLYLDKKAFIDIVNSQYQNCNIYVGFCELGYCVRMKKDIKKGELIYTFKGPTISFDETKTSGIMECMSLQYGFDKYIDTEAPGRFVNHSCEPNTGIIDDFDLVALEDIPIHSEIRFDYSTTMDEDYYQMECKCGKPSCRKVVTDFKLLPEETRKRYLDLNIVMNFIKAQY